MRLLFGLSLALAARSAHAGPIESEVARLLSSADGAAGTVAGAPATFRIDTSGRYRQQADTVLTVRFPVSSLLLLLRRANPTSDATDQAAGRLVDVTVGDPAFDDAFIVAGAPSDLVRALLDAPTRSAVADLGDVIVNIDGSSVVVDVGGRPQSVEQMQKLFGLAELLVRRLGAPIEPPADIRLTDAARAQEMTHLRASRAQQHTNNVLSMIPAMLAGFAVFGLVIYNLRRRRRA